MAAWHRLKLNHKIRKIIGNRQGVPKFGSFSLPQGERERLAAEAKTDLERIFYRHQGRLIHKWPHYLAVYEQYLGPRRGTGVRMLEIGVYRGGSLQMWRQYLGERATIVGIDIDPNCAGLADPPNMVRIGSQDDPVFLRGVVEEMGGVDVVLDDGSHIGEHQVASFNALFPLLPDGGLYIIEDMHTAYWPTFMGGFRRPGSAVEFVKDLIDDLHGWYHARSSGTPGKDQVESIHIFDSVTVIVKRARARPGHMVMHGPQYAERGDR